jgi:hypothetical protein
LLSDDGDGKLPELTVATQRSSMLPRTFLCLLLALGLPSRAFAEPESAAECVDRLDDRGVRELLGFVETSAREQRLGAALWFGGWSAFNVGNVTAGAWKLATVHDRVEHDTWLMTTIGAGGFLAGAALLPLPGLYGYRRLERARAGSPAQRREKLRLGLELLERAAAGEDRNSNLTAHLGAVLFGVFSAGYIYLHNLHGDMKQVGLAAGLQLGSTLLGGEATLWSVPRRARRDLEYVHQRICPTGRTHAALGRVPRRAPLEFDLLPGGLRLRF